MICWLNLFVLLANRGILNASLAGMVLVLACASSQALEENNLGAAGDPAAGSIIPGLPDAQQPASDQKPAYQRVNWVVGPATVHLGGVAEFVVPADHKFADERSARLFLEQLRNPVPKNLVGFLIPPSGEWFAILELSDPGYVKDHDATQLNSEEILAAIRRIAARQRATQGDNAGPVVESVHWAVEPNYDPATRKVEWAIKAVSRGGVVVNYIVRHLGRQHVLDFVGVLREDQKMDLTPVKTAAQGMSFLAGHRYEDFQAGDKLANSTLAQLLIAQDQEADGFGAGVASSDPTKATAQTTVFIWVAAGLLGLFVVGVVVLVYRSLNRPRQTSDNTSEQQKTHPVKAEHVRDSERATGVVVSGEKQVSPFATAPVSLPSLARTRLEKAPERNHRKQQKRYMYDKFYSRMIMRLSGSEYGNGSGNGSGNGDTEVIYNQAACPLTDGVKVLDFERELATKASALIETQTDLIEIQRKFIEEQRKLIEEQRKLFYAQIEETKTQSHVFGK